MVFIQIYFFSSPFFQTNEREINKKKTHTQQIVIMMGKSTISQLNLNLDLRKYLTKKNNKICNLPILNCNTLVGRLRSVSLFLFASFFLQFNQHQNTLCKHTKKKQREKNSVSKKS